MLTCSMTELAARLNMPPSLTANCKNWRSAVHWCGRVRVFWFQTPPRWMQNTELIDPTALP